MRVMVAVPYSRTISRSLESILAMDGDQLDIVFLSEGDEPGAHRYDNITRKYQTARRMALDGSYGALLCVEDDIIIPPNTLTRLAAVDADVAYGLVCARHEPYFWSAATVVAGDAEYRSLDEGFNRKQWGKTVTVAGCGLFCTLIRRHVLEALDFHRDTPNCCDWDFSIDCQQRGFMQAADLGVVCGHVREDGSVIWPDPTKRYKVEA